MGRRIPSPVTALSVTFLILASVWPWTGRAQAQEESGSKSLLWPIDAKYVGLAKCAACHFDQYKDWRGSQHSKAFEILPVKYRNDASCLKCHTTGNVADASSHPYGVSCQACHGPGEEHANFALKFVNEIITEDGLTELRGKIRRLDMHQCVNCHISKAHKKHPPYDGQEALRRSGQKQSTGFFDSVHAKDDSHDGL